MFQLIFQSYHRFQGKLAGAGAARRSTMRSRKIALLLAPALAALPLLAAGCGDDDPSVNITTPDEGEELDVGDVQVAIEVENFQIVDKLGDPPKAGEGHVHFYIDVEDVPTAQGEPAVTEDENTYHAEATNSFTWEGVEAGEHTFAVQLVNNDHTPLDPPVVEEVTVEVTGAGGDGDEEPTRTPGRTSTPEESPEETPEGTAEATPERTATPTPRTSPTTTP
jgi:uncharacterized protein DUF4399